MKKLYSVLGKSLAATLLATLCITAGSCAEIAPLPEKSQLSNLAIMPGELVPAFSKDITSYEATVPTDLPSLVIVANTDDGNATIAINGLSVPSGANQSVSLGPPGMPTPIEVAISSQDGEVVTYIVTVTRIAGCMPTSDEECCPQDYQERPCGIGGCGKETRTCGASGTWEPWSTCGVNSARTGQVCRAKAQGNSCDPVEVCGDSVDCPPDYVEVALEGYTGCWQNITGPQMSVSGKCSLPAPPAGYNSCKPNHVLTADHLCVLAGYKGHKHGTMVRQAVAGDIIGWVVWNGTSWQRETGKVYAMTHVTCLK